MALYFKKYIEKHNLARVDIIDLDKYQFPIFHERLRFMKDPSVPMLEFTGRVTSADGIIIVTPEYNGGYPASLKNIIDLLYHEWQRKPIAISTVSDGIFGGSQVITSLVFTLWKIRAWVVPVMFPVPKVQDKFDESGEPLEEALDKRAETFMNELLWCIQAKKKMEEH